MFCSNCKKPLPKGNIKFCPNCGTTIFHNEITTPATAAPMSITPRRRKKFIIIACIALAIIASVFILWFIFNLTGSSDLIGRWEAVSLLDNTRYEDIRPGELYYEFFSDGRGVITEVTRGRTSTTSFMWSVNNGNLALNFARDTSVLSYLVMDSTLTLVHNDGHNHAEVVFHMTTPHYDYNEAIRRRDGIELFPSILITSVFPQTIVTSLGERVNFGGYVWRVLDIYGNYALLLTEGVVGFRPFHNNFSHVTWETSDIRSWLNNEFYNSFSIAERISIRDTSLPNYDYSQVIIIGEWSRRWPQAADTNDRIFLLSRDEYFRYLNVHRHDGYSFNDGATACGSSWWLRSAILETDMSNVAQYGRMEYYREDIWGWGDDGGLSHGWGEGIVTDYIGVRPALWLRIAPFDAPAIPSPPPILESLPRTWFGRYEWLVLDRQGDYSLILSKNILDHMPFHDDRVARTWATSNMRGWLNGEFFNHFSADEQSRIRMTTIDNNGNPWYGTHGGVGTADHVFLLSAEEVIRYYGDSGLFINRYRGYVSDHYNTGRIAQNADGNNTQWWLRTSGNIPERTVVVYGDGRISMFGSGINPATPSVPVYIPVPPPPGAPPPPLPTFNGVRPAMWVRLG